MKLRIRTFLICLVLHGIQAFAQEQIKPNDLQRERIYSIILSRFSDGDVENNFFNRENIDPTDPHYRGDLKGAAAKPGYIIGSPINRSEFTFELFGIHLSLIGAITDQTDTH